MFQGDKPLEKVALLYNKDRLHFSLVGPQLDKDCQFAPGNLFEQPSPIETKSYSVQVR